MPPPPEAEKLASILKICQKVNAERDLGALFHLVAREAARLMEADRASIFLLDRDRSELWSQVALGSENALRFDARLGIAGAAALTGRTINVPNAYDDARFYPAMDGRTGYKTRNLLAVPLRNHAGETIGAFEVLNKKRGAFTDDDEELLKSLAAHVAIAVETAQLVGELREGRDQLEEENTQLRREVEGRFATQGIVGASAKIQAVVRLIEQIRDSAVNVLITGETGTGKELVARALHHTSPRARRPFVALNCAALPETLVETELFGVEKGVATGVDARAGKFEEANGGTLFLDEIGDLSLVSQAKILRALQEQVIERLGGRKSIPVDARILSATNKDLRAEIRQKAFRDDLYYRLKVIEIHMPALREIREDIPLLANHFLDQSCKEMNKAPKKFQPSAMRRLQEAYWPGNVRQLQNEVKRLVACAPRKWIGAGELSATATDPGEEPAARTLLVAVGQVEREMIDQALDASHGNQAKAARLLGLSRQGLINKMKRYRMDVARMSGVGWE